MSQQVDLAHAENIPVLSHGLQRLWWRQIRTTLKSQGQITSLKPSGSSPVSSGTRLPWPAHRGFALPSNFRL